MLVARPARAAEPEAVAHQLVADGEAKLASGDRPGGIEALMRAYAALADPLRDRTHRGDLVGILHAELMDLHEDTGDPAYLCQLRGLLITHAEALIVALGQEAGPTAVAGSLGRLREAGERMRTKHPQTHCASDAWRSGQPRPEQAPATAPSSSSPPVAFTQPPQPAPLRPYEPATIRHRRAVGGVLLGVAGLTAIGAAISVALYVDRFRRLDALERWLTTPAEAADMHALSREASHARTSASILGIGTAVLLTAGIAVLVKARRSRPVSLTPTAAPTVWGLHLTGRF